MTPMFFVHTAFKKNNWQLPVSSCHFYTFCAYIRTSSLMLLRTSASDLVHANIAGNSDVGKCVSRCKYCVVFI